MALEKILGKTVSVKRSHVEKSLTKRSLLDKCPKNVLWQNENFKNYYLLVQPKNPLMEKIF